MTAYWGSVQSHSCGDGRSYLLRLTHRSPLRALALFFPDPLSTKSGQHQRPPYLRASCVILAAFPIIAEASIGPRGQPGCHRHDTASRSTSSRKDTFGGPVSRRRASSGRPKLSCPCLSTCQTQQTGVQTEWRRASSFRSRKSRDLPARADPQYVLPNPFSPSVFSPSVFSPSVFSQWFRWKIHESGL